MTVCALLIGDGRDDYHRISRDSFYEHVTNIDHVVEIDDRDHRLGFRGAVRKGWAKALATGADFIWHHELDFTYNREIPILEMADVLDRHRYLTQIALIRQPWNDEEAVAGGIAALIADQLTPMADGEHQWLEHRRHWTTYPSLYPRWIAERGWPQVRYSEGIFGGELFKSDPALRSSYWGTGEEWCHHIGDERTGTGY